MILGRIIGIILGAKLGLLSEAHVGVLGGAFLGFILGYSIDSGLIVYLAKKKAQKLYLEVFDKAFIEAVFPMLAKLSKVDGFIKKEEIAVVQHIFKNVLKLNKKEKAYARRIFNTSKDSPTSFHSYAVRYYELFETQPEMLIRMIDLLVMVAKADGQINDLEKKLIKGALNIFNLDENYLEQLVATNKEPLDLSKCYEILGCNEKDSPSKIKQQYRELASKYHPDKIIGKELPEDFIAFANEKFQAIQNAYEAIKNAKDFA